MDRQGVHSFPLLWLLRGGLSCAEWPKDWLCSRSKVVGYKEGQRETTDVLLLAKTKEQLQIRAVGHGYNRL